LLVVATDCRKSNEWEALCWPVAKLIEEILEICERYKTAFCYDFLSVVAKAAPCLAWIASATPTSHISQVRTPLDSFIAKLSKDHKGRELYLTFLENFGEFWKGLENYVRTNFANGLSNGNSNGKDSPHILKFPKRGYPYGIMKDISPKLQIDSATNKWYCENQSSVKIINVEGDKKQTCYIRNCSYSKIQIKGKPSTVSLDSCSYTKLIVDSLPLLNISSCYRIIIIFTGAVSNININKTHKCEIKFLDIDNNSNVEISSIASTRITIKDKNGSSEIPTVLRTKIQKGKLQTIL